jgi:hypothetical protein
MLTSREAQQRASTAYSITLSVMAMSVCGIVIASAFAVLRLIEGVGLLYGHLGGLRAFEDLVSEFGGAPEHSRHIWAVRDQAAGFGIGFASGATWRKNARRIGRVGSRKVRSKARFGRPASFRSALASRQFRAPPGLCMRARAQQPTLLFDDLVRRRRRVSVRAAIHATGHPDYRGCRLRPADARTLLILAVRFGSDRVLRGRLLRLGPGCTSRTGSDCVLTDCGCVLRTASASISCSSALVGVEGFVILPLFLFRLRGFPGQALSLQSFAIFPEGFLLCFVFR